jgi:outer membrane immunogenic protein
MKSVVSVSTAAFALVFAGAAQAADLPTAPAYKAPAVAAVYNWTGMYVGVNGSYGWVIKIRSFFSETGLTAQA